MLLKPMRSPRRPRATSVTRGPLFALALLAAWPATAQTFFGPAPYLSVADVPSGFYAAGGPDVLEDFEDCSLDFGITASAGTAISNPSGSCATTSPYVDSVDADDGVIDGSGSAGNSWFSSFGPSGVTFSFPAPVPEAALVWTDGEGDATFEAFGPGMISLGTIGPAPLDTGDPNGSTAEDRFLGVTDPGGIVAIRVSNTAGGIEIDHVQTGAPLPPPPSTFYGPTPYLSVADVPPGLYAGGTPGALEDFEDCSLDFDITADNGDAISPLGGPCVSQNALVDSVDADDGAIDGDGSQGNSWFSTSGPAGVTFTFAKPVRSAGLVWTDGEGDTTFQAFAPGMISLGTIGPVTLDMGDPNGTTSEDRFFGVTAPGGIVALRISNTVGGIEIDHVQTSVPAVPMGPLAPGLIALGLGLVGVRSLRRR